MEDPVSPWLNATWSTVKSTGFEVNDGQVARVVHVKRDRQHGNQELLKVEVCDQRHTPCRILDDVRGMSARSFGAPAYLDLRLPSGPADTVCNEQDEFLKRCGGRAAELAAHLETTKHRRGLAIEFTNADDLSSWGLGNVLPVVYMLHSWCIELRRYCHIKMWSMQLSELFTYYTGHDWGFSPEHLARYPRKVLINASVGTTLESLHATIAAVDSQTPLIQVRNIAMGTRSLGAFRSDVWLRDTDRCLNHFVTRPAFALPTLERTPTHGFHFRTGFADVPDSFLGSVNRSAHETRHWFAALQCSNDLFRKLGSDAISISDSLGFSQWMHAEFGTQHISHPVVPTRSWMSGIESKRAAAVDLVISSLTRVFYLTGESHFPGPMLARSMCTREVRPLRDACSMVQRGLPTDLAPALFFSDCGRGRQACIHKFLQKNVSALPGHPCTIPRLSPSELRHACGSSYLAAFAPPTSTR
mmetsp:Transcript_29570/g.76371  ORF Transcript_29570/g.76371 Transcript_29570/m.76371 type:complete len:472 (+) Transcript_29570:164-1579(+)|eukprot:CAMPEP_0115842782 /NCGR_PEP_ID=MMETSP0287-20121206/7975_1 /TAXON_ID=412157 /ORGANISM="Chrysochromulina rotalis, Strain UIO044" /LENGTH=471 /DNA_ID=CAMNT_0003296457 /DNA_START=80 /DNA_END=1495 /DNA_ORIENTATION=-